jgi:diadenosine tetraphosphatase ApaH/serine/threonine PP2A family protein phosphatase
MKYAILGDVHANLEALTAVLEKAESLGVDRYLCIGDIVGYNSNPSECLDLIRGLNCEVVIKGNHDDQASRDLDLEGFNPQAAFAIKWTRDHLTQEQKDWLVALPYSKMLDQKVTLVHGTLDMPQMWGYVFDRLAAAASFGYQYTQICFFGHTHVPLAFDKFGEVGRGEKYQELHFEAGHKYMVNVSSVGQPRDGDPRAGFLVYSPDERMAELHRVEYDLEACQKKIIKAGLPERLAQRLASGR